MLFERRVSGRAVCDWLTESNCRNEIESTYLIARPTHPLWGPSMKSSLAVLITASGFSPKTSTGRRPRRSVFREPSSDIQVLTSHAVDQAHEFHWFSIDECGGLPGTDDSANDPIDRRLTDAFAHGMQNLVNSCGMKHLLESFKYELMLRNSTLAPFNPHMLYSHDCWP